MDGVLNVFKPAGISSYDVIRHIKRIVKGLKIGHAGTLDPFATGVLVVLLGRSTRSAERWMDEPKTYEGTVLFGVETDTADITGKMIARMPWPEPPADVLQKAAASFVGEVEQVPPMFSALRFGGKRLYEIARSGQVVERAPRKVRIYSFEIMEISWPRMRFRAQVGRGTYLRSLAADMGRKIGPGACLESLCRTAVGSLKSGNACGLQELNSIEAIMGRLEEY